MALEALSNVLSKVADRVRSRTDYENRKADQLAEEQRREATVVRAEDRAEGRAKRLREFDAETEFNSFKRLDTEQQYRKAEQLGIPDARSMSPGELGVRVREKLNEIEAGRIKNEAVAKYDAADAIRSKDANRVVDPKEIENKATSDIMENGGAILAGLAKSVENRAKIEEIAKREPEVGQFIQAKVAERQHAAGALLDARLRDIDKMSGSPKTRAQSLLNEVTSTMPLAAVDVEKVKDPMQRVAVLENVLRANAAVWAEKQNLLPDAKAQTSEAIAQLRMSSSADQVLLQGVMNEQYALSKELLKYSIIPGVTLDQQPYLPQRAKEHLQTLGSQKTLGPAGASVPSTAPAVPTGAGASSYWGGGQSGPSAPLPSVPPVTNAALAAAPATSAGLLPNPYNDPVVTQENERQSGTYWRQQYGEPFNDAANEVDLIDKQIARVKTGRYPGALPPGGLANAALGIPMDYQVDQQGQAKLLSDLTVKRQQAVTRLQQAKGAMLNRPQGSITPAPSMPGPSNYFSAQ